MPRTTPPADLLDHHTRSPNADKLAVIRDHARLARQLELDRQDLEARLNQTKANLHRMYTETLVNLMDELGIDRIGIPAEGNLPAADLVVAPFYSANIPTGWPPERREAALQALTLLGHEDLIKTLVSIQFNRDARAEALQWVE